MRRTGVQRLAFASLSLLILLIVAGAVVRVTGSGLGCPDWPTCWGELIPPSKVEQVDFEKLDIERFKKSAKRFGRDPDEITIEKLRSEFNGTQTWIEFVNRLLALPLTLTTFILMIACLRSGRHQKLGIASFAMVIISALTGIVVVASGLKTGVVTIHMALAFLLLFFLVYLVWASGEGARPQIPGPGRPAMMVLLACVMIEWFMGSQIREMTDHLQMEKGTASRPEWIHEIRDSWWFLIHRSFSWSIFFVALYLGWRVDWKGKVPLLVLGVVFILMIMGIVLTYAGIHAVVQVLHVGLAGVLISAVYYWYLAAVPAKKGGDSA